MGACGDSPLVPSLQFPPFEHEEGGREGLEFFLLLSNPAKDSRIRRRVFCRDPPRLESFFTPSYEGRYAHTCLPPEYDHCVIFLKKILVGNGVERRRVLFNLTSEAECGGEFERLETNLLNIVSASSGSGPSLIAKSASDYFCLGHETREQSIGKEICLNY